MVEIPQEQNGTLMSHRQPAELILGTVVFVTIILGTAVGNTLVIWAICSYRPLKRAQNLFLISLAVADLAVAVLVMPYHVVKFITNTWPFGLFMCQLWLTFDIWLCTASILNLCAIALDRYWAIHDPINYANRRTIRLVVGMMVTVWLCSGFISVPPLLGWNDWSDERLAQTCKYTTNAGFVVFSAMCSFFVPLMLMAFVYLKIFIAARSRLRRRSLASRGGSVRSVRHQPSIKSVKGIAIGTIGFRTDSNDIAVKKESTGSFAFPSFDESSPNCAKDIFRRNASLMRQNELRQHPRKLSQTPFVERFDFANSSIKSRLNLRNFRKNSRTNNSMYRSPSVVSSASSAAMSSYFKEREKISITKEKKAAKTLAIIMGVFVLCWLPFFTIYLLEPICGDHCYVHVKIFEACNWLGYINSSLNPVIYTIFNLDFRKAFLKIFRKCKKK